MIFEQRVDRWYSDMIVVWITCSYFGKSTLSALNNSHNDSEQSQSTTEDFHNQDLHKRVRILSVSDSTSGTWYSNANSRVSVKVPAEEVTEAYWDTGPKECISCKSTLSPICAKWALIAYFSLKNDCHDDTVDSHGFTENNAEWIEDCTWPDF